MDITGKSTVRLIQIYLILLFCLGTYCVLIWDKKWIGSNFVCLELVDFQSFFFFFSPELLVCAQSCLTFCNHMNCSPPGSSVPWNFPGRNIGVGCHFLLQGIFPTQALNLHLLCLLHCRRVLYQVRIQNCEVLAAQSCLMLCEPMGCSPPGSSVHGILRAKILEWVSIAFSRGSS